MNHRPPNKILRFLRWFCKQDRIEEIEGDLVELYEKRLILSTKSAKWKFALDVLKSLRWMNIKKPRFLFNRTLMIRSYIKIGFRNVVKDFNYSLINILGLSLGLAAFIIMIMMVHSEFTFDRFHTKSDRIYEVIQEFQNTQGADPEVHTSLLLANALREEMAMVENAVTIHSAADTWMEINGNRFFENNGIVASSEFFKIFDYPLKYGEKDQVLKNSRSIVLDELMATKLFGQENPVGEFVEIERYGLFMVSGIMKSLPANSFIQFNFIITQDYDVFFTHVASWFPPWFQSWQGDPATTFVLLRDNTDAPDFQRKIKPILKKYLGENDLINPHYLINLRDLHFGSNGIDGRVNEYVKGDIHQIRLLVAVALLILVMACFNYINISTARSIHRTKEVGIRKSVGALKGQITSQMLTESFLQVIFAFILSLGWIYISLPYFQNITGVQLTINTGVILKLIPYILATIAIVSIIAGLYPALYLSRFTPVKILTNTVISAKGNSVLRNGLVMVQYGLVIIMLASLLIVNQQFQHLRKKNLGFNTDHLVVVEVNGGGVRRNYQNIKSELLTNSKITDVTVMTRMISGYRSSVGIYAVDEENPDIKRPLNFYGMDEDGIQTLGLNIKTFKSEATLDSTSVFLNETAAELFGGQQIVGEWIILTDVEDNDFLFHVRVIGIVEDFHYRSLHEPIGPVVIGYYLNPFEGMDDIVIKVSSNDYAETISYIESIHNKFDENDVMTWEFADDMVQRAYEKELIFRDVFFGASVISLFIALLGIIGLISYNVIAKTKELGIRKVLGASYLQILSLQGKSFFGFIIVSVLIATPVTWWIASLWLQDYAYRIEVTPIPFLKAMGVILISTLITIWIINHKSARKNPVEALRYQ